VVIPKWEPKYKKKKENYEDISKQSKLLIELENQEQFPEFD
jgi:hypothetical protein